MNWRALVLCVVFGWSGTTTGQTTDIARKIISIYLSTCETPLDLTDAHRFAELPLNHLGLEVVHLDVSDPNVTDALESDVRGILWWVTPCAVDSPEALFGRIQRLVGGDLPFVIIGNITQITDRAGRAAPTTVRNSILHKLGIEQSDETVDVTLSSRVHYQNRQFVGYERKVVPPIAPYGVYRIIESQAVPLLTLRRDVPSLSESHVVTMSPEGCFIDSNFAVYRGRFAAFSQWWINPFYFFSDCFSVGQAPAPDPTTLSGRRVQIAHLDAAGLSTRTAISSRRQSDVYAANVAASLIDQGVSSLPITVAVDAVEFGANPPSQASLFGIRQLFKTNTADLVLRTDLTERNPDPLRASGVMLPVVSNPLSTTPNLNQFELSVVAQMETTFSAKPIEFVQDDAGSNAASLGVNYSHYDRLMVLERALSTKVEVANMPPWRLAGQPSTIYIQRFATNIVQPGSVGAERLRSQLEYSERPRRLRPYETAFSLDHGKTLAAYNEMKAALFVSHQTDLIARRMSEYRDLLRDFTNVRITRDRASRWLISQRGAVQTVRFDNATDQCIWFDQSQGVIGQRHINGALYVALDQDVEEATVATKTCSIERALPRQERIYLIDANRTVRGLKVVGETVTFNSGGYGPGEMRWAMPRVGRYQVTITAQDYGPVDVHIDTDEHGVMLIKLDSNPASVNVVVKPAIKSV